MSGKWFDEYGVPVVTPLRMTVALVAGVVVIVGGGILANTTVVAVGLVIVVVAFCIAIPAWRNRRYRGQPLARPPAYGPVQGCPAAGWVGQRRGARKVVRRRAGVAYVFALLGAGLCGALMVTPAGYIDAGIVFAAGMGAFICVGSLATGPMAWFVVSARFLDICTANRIVRVPRAMIAEFIPGQKRVTLHLTNGESLDFRVDSVLWDVFDKADSFTNPRSQVRTVNRIVAAMRAVPPIHMSSGVQVKRIPRPWMIACLVLAGLALFATTIAATT